MKVLDILAEVDLKYPNDVEKAHILGWITTLEKQLLDEVLMTHEITEDELKKAAAIYAMQSVTQDYEPLVQPPYQEVYVHYLGMQIALVNVDNDQYENEQTLYNSALLTYKNWFNRTHRCKSKADKWRF